MLRAVVLALLLAGTAAAHVPTFGQAGGSPETAFFVRDPDQSRVFYGELAAGAQHWFRFERNMGDAIDVSLHLPASELERPTLWIVGPGMVGEGPRGTPMDLGSTPAAILDDLSIEPFTPLAMREVASSNAPAAAKGTFFVVIETETAATYSVAIGAGESFTAVEWVGIPIQRIGIASWAGIPWPLAMVGEALAVAVVLTVAWRHGVPLQARLGFAGAGAIAGTAMTSLLLALVAAFQAGTSAGLVVPIVFAGAALAIGWGSFRAVRGSQPWHALAWAVGGLALWAGLIVGPAMLAGWAIWKMRSDTGREVA